MRTGTAIKLLLLLVLVFGGGLLLWRYMTSGTLYLHAAITGLPYRELALHIERVQLVGGSGTAVTVLDETLFGDPQVERLSEHTSTTKLRRGTYTGMLITAVVVADIGDESVPLPAPQEEFLIPLTLTIADDDVSSLIFTVDLHRSIRTTVKGDPVFLPVVLVEARSSVSFEKSGELLHTAGGTIETNSTYGADVYGVMKSNFALPMNTPLLLADGVLTVAPLPEPVSKNSDTSETYGATATTGTTTLQPDMN